MADILRNSPAREILGLKDEEESQSNEDKTTPGQDEETAEGDPEASTGTENEAGDEETTDEKSDENAEEATEESTEAALPTEDEVDWDYKVPVKVDGKLEYKTLGEIRKGFATEQHLSQKGRELGDLKKAVETERTEKLQELVTLGTVLHEELSGVETQLGTKYHELSAAIEKARDEGDSFKARELKEEREAIQEKYWGVRNKREAGTKAVVEKIQAKQAEDQQKLLDAFQKEIVTAVPGFNDKVAKSVREFAISEGIPPALLDVIYDAKVVKFINDYRVLKGQSSKGVAKLKAAPVAKSAPVKKAPNAQVKQAAANQAVRAKVFGGQASAAEQNSFLKSLSSIAGKL
jgi:hypothetical protein